jgi:hypothetical protein
VQQIPTQFPVAPSYQIPAGVGLATVTCNLAGAFLQGTTLVAAGDTIEVTPSSCAAARWCAHGR